MRQPPAASAGRRRLPIGIQTFRRIRERGFYYVDKTDYARRLIEEGSYYFLSRPRRFGKSLFVDTLKELFEGNEPLFRRLAVHDHWDWSVRHPVMRLDFGAGSFRNPEHVHRETMAQLVAIEERAGIEGRYDWPSGRFRDLIETLHRRSGQPVVVLVDEYDKPVLDALETPEVARSNRDFLRGLYSNLKVADAQIEFAFLTGVSRFSRVSLFSDLNNLEDITLAPRYSAICGYTDADLDRVFAPELAGLDREAIRDWYNGYSWRGEEKVYNPFDILLLFRNREFNAWWFETATPRFLVEALRKGRIGSVNLDGMRSTRALLSAFEVEDIKPEALLFQTGYLTIVEEKRQPAGPASFRLGYPNREVRESLNEYLLGMMTPAESRDRAPGFRLLELLAANDFEGIEALLRAFFSAIPYEWHTKNPMARSEGYYASVFYSYVAAAGLEVTVEDRSNRGRVDMAVRYGESITLFEFKVVEQARAGAALAPLRAKGYADKYRAEGRPIWLVGVEFSSAERNLTGFAAEPA